MSYCRWSSLNWMCDIYCYEDATGGWTTHVAGRRWTREPVPELDMGQCASKEWLASHQATMADLETIPIENIGLAHDGETFNDPTLEEFRDRLLMLREAGYNVPDYALDEIEREMADAVTEKKP